MKSNTMAPNETTSSGTPINGRKNSHAKPIVAAERAIVISPASSAMSISTKPPRNGMMSASTEIGLVSMIKPMNITTVPTPRKIQVIISLSAFAIANISSALCLPIRNMSRD